MTGTYVPLKQEHFKWAFVITLVFYATGKGLTFPSKVQL